MPVALQGLLGTVWGKFSGHIMLLWCWARKTCGPPSGGCSQGRSQALHPLSPGKGSIALGKPKHLRAAGSQVKCAHSFVLPYLKSQCPLCPWQHWVSASLKGCVRDPSVRTESLKTHSCLKQTVRAGFVKCWVTFPGFFSSWPVSYYCLPTARRRWLMGSDSLLPTVKYHQV